MNRFRVIWIFALWALTLSWLAGPTPAVAGKSDDTIAMAISAPLVTCDPRAHRNRNTLIRDWHVFDPLLRRDSKTLKTKPGLALSVKQTGKLTWEMKLRRGVRFHNGEPFNADSVIYTFKTVLKKKNKFRMYGKYKWAKKVTKKGPYTIGIRTKKPFPILKDFLVLQIMAPPQFAKRAGRKKMAVQCVGTGPYKMTGWTKGVKFTAVRNDKYWGPKARIKNIAIRPIKEESTRIAELLNGGVDLIRQVSPDQIDTINKSGKATVKSAPILRVVYLRMDSMGRDKKSHPALKDVRVRRAIAHAINVDGIIKHILKGYGRRTATGFSQLMFGYDPSVKPISYDPGKAKKLLAAAGYPNGFTVKLYSSMGSIVAVRQLAEAVQADLQKVGIRGKIHIYSSGGLAQRAARAGRQGDPTIGSHGGSSIYDMAYIIGTLFHSKAQRAYWKDKKLDKQINTGARNFDRKTRMAAYKKAQKIIRRNMYWVPMYSQYEIVGLGNSVDYTPPGDEVIRLYEAKWK